MSPKAPLPSAQRLTLTLPQPHPSQQKIIQQAKRFNVVCCGRRWGKTFLAVDQVIHPFLKGYPVALFSPTYKILGDAWRQLVNVLAPLDIYANKQEGRIESDLTKGSIEVWTLQDPDAGRSRKYKLVVIDEAAMCPNLEETWHNCIRPTLTDYQGKAWFLSTPRGQNFFKVLYDRGQDPSEREWKSWSMPTITNPYIPASEVEAARNELPEKVYQQEYQAKFLEDIGAVFRNIYGCLKAKGQTLPQDGHEYVIGVDWGKQQDFTVITVLDATAMELAMIDRFNQIDYKVQSNRLVKWCNHWKPTKILAERNSIGEPLLESLYRQGLPIEGFHTNNPSKVQIIEDLAHALETEAIQLYEHKVLIGELQAYEGRISKAGNTIYGAPEGSHDDCVISLALAYHAAKPVKKKPSLMEMLKSIDRAKMRV